MATEVGREASLGRMGLETEVLGGFWGAGHGLLLNVWKFHGVFPLRKFIELYPS